jgi:hypothetical protein
MQTQSRSKSIAKVMILIAGGLTVCMAGYHFFLPSAFGWADEVKTVHPTVRWALFSLNIFFSYLLLALGLITIIGAIARRTGDGIYHLVLLSGAIFWLINGCYQLLIPMPMPESFVILRYFLKSFAFGVAVLYLIPLVYFYRGKSNSE